MRGNDKAKKGDIMFQSPKFEEYRLNAVWHTGFYVNFQKFQSPKSGVYRLNTEQGFTVWPVGYTVSIPKKWGIKELEIRSYELGIINSQ